MRMIGSLVAMGWMVAWLSGCGGASADSSNGDGPDGSAPDPNWAAESQAACEAACTHRLDAKCTADVQAIESGGGCSAECGSGVAKLPASCASAYIDEQDCYAATPLECNASGTSLGSIAVNCGEQNSATTTCVQDPGLTQMQAPGCTRLCARAQGSRIDYKYDCTYPNKGTAVSGTNSIIGTQFSFSYPGTAFFKQYVSQGTTLPVQISWDGYSQGAAPNGLVPPQSCAKPLSDQKVVDVEAGEVDVPIPQGDDYTTMCGGDCGEQQRKACQIWVCDECDYVDTSGRVYMSLGLGFTCTGRGTYGDGVCSISGVAIAGAVPDGSCAAR